MSRSGKRFILNVTAMAVLVTAHWLQPEIPWWALWAMLVLGYVFGHVDSWIDRA